MFDKELKELEFISQAVGNSPDLVQGGGGNTSVKLNDELMAVKASGYKLNQIRTNEGYVVVNYKNIKAYYENVDLSSGTDYEKESTEVTKKNIIEIAGLKVLRPSVEAGFHSILKKYVLHTHAVYANILCCSKTGKELVGKMFEAKDFACIWIPYINPGFSLTLEIQKAINECIDKCGVFPEVIFMENHGLIINTDNCERGIKLHEEVNGLIKRVLGIDEPYPQIVLTPVDDVTYISKTEYLAKYFAENRVNDEFFDTVVLYPDQLVYLNGGISVNGTESKLNINTVSGEIIYRTSYSEALTMEETLLAYIYVVDKIKQLELPLKTMSQEEISFIANWESEKYRKSIASSS